MQAEQPPRTKKHIKLYKRSANELFAVDILAYKFYLHVLYNFDLINLKYDGKGLKFMTIIKAFKHNRPLVTALLMFALLACNNQQQHRVTTLRVNRDIQAQVGCDQSLQELVRHSTLKSPFKKQVRPVIEKEEGEELTIQLLVPGDNQTENTVGWILINTTKKTIMDITNDPENPEPLRYQAKDWDRFVSCRAAQK